MDTLTAAPTCDMAKDCTAPVTYLGNKGYVYCKEHGVARRQYGYESTRAMRPWEIRWINSGRVLRTYAAGPEPRA